MCEGFRLGNSGVVPMSMRDICMRWAYSHLINNLNDMEALMNILMDSHSEHELDQLANRFECWRQRRTTPRERIPPSFWEQAAW